MNAGETCTRALALLDEKPALKTAAFCTAAGIGLYTLRAILRRVLLGEDKTPPGSLGLPLLGETLSFVLDPQAFAAKRKRQHGPIFKTHVLFSPAVYLDGEHAKLIFKNTHIGWPGNWNELLGPYSMAAISGPRHKFQRSVCASAFQPAALKSYVSVLQDLTMKHMGAWASSSSGFHDPEPEIQRYTFEVAEKILLGVSSADMDSSGDGLLRVLNIFKAWLAGYQGLVPWNVPWTAHGKAMRARGQLMGEYQKIIDFKRANPKEDSRDMLTNVMAASDNGEAMSDAELLDFCLVMMFAGHDTTKCSIQTLLYYIDKYPDIAKEIELEVASVWDGKAAITWDMAEKLQKGKCGRFIDETLRLRSPVAALYREVQQDMEYQGYTIPKGWKIMTSPIVQNEQVSANRDIDLSIDHSKLREDQFSPFGGGSRKCIGYNFAKLELIIWLMCTLRHFCVEVDSGSTKPVNVPFIFYQVTARFSKKA